MSNDDKNTFGTHVQMKLRFDAPTVVYIVKLDTHQLSWLATGSWARSSLTGVSYSGVHQTRHTEWAEELLVENHYGPGEVYEKLFPAGAFEMPGNNAGDGSYLVFVANPSHRPTPPVGDLWRPVLGSENGERVKCNDNVDMVYVADQAACQMLAISNGHPFYSFRHNGEGSGHKCMSSAHCDDHMTERNNEWHIYSSAPAPVQYYLMGYGSGNSLVPQASQCAGLLGACNTPGYANCPDGHVVDTHEECEAAHIALGLEVAPKWTGNYNGIPGACSTREVNAGGQHHFHFNSQLVGSVRGDLSPVCRV
jgi:hypothetical protein